MTYRFNTPVPSATCGLEQFRCAERALYRVDVLGVADEVCRHVEVVDKRRSFGFQEERPKLEHIWSPSECPNSGRFARFSRPVLVS